jgi:hypothetical protein
MSTKTNFDLTGLSRAIQGRDCRYHLALHANDAEVEIFDSADAAAPLQVLRGKSAIGEWLRGMTSSDVQYEVRDATAHPDRVTYTEVCRYRDGSSVQLDCRAEVRRGQITHAALTLVDVPRHRASSRAMPPWTSGTTEVSPATRAPRPASSRLGTSRQLPGNFLG